MVFSRKEQPPGSVNEARRHKIPRVEPKEKSISRAKAEMFRARDSSAMASQAEDSKLEFFMEAPIFNTLHTKRVFDAKNSMLSRSFRLSRWFGRA